MKLSLNALQPEIVPAVVFTLTFQDLICFFSMGACSPAYIPVVPVAESDYVRPAPNHHPL